jgi:hypothetical protein
MAYKTCAPSGVIFMSPFLGAIEKLGNTIIGFLMSVCLSFCPHEKIQLQLEGIL